MKTTLLSRRLAAKGFSLAEVALSVAIAGMGLTSILGLVPEGLNTMKKAGDVATETRITQQILSTLTQAEWKDEKGKDVISDLDGTKYYYDDLAMEVSKDDPFLAYVAEVDVPESDIALPADSIGTSKSNEYLRRVNVKVTNRSSPSFNFDEAEPGSYRQYASLISRGGR